MRVASINKFGNPAEVLAIQDADKPSPGPGEVLVRMLAAPVNPSDVMTIQGTYGKQPALPFTPGYEGVGVVESSGGGLLAKMMVGKRVAVGCRDGGGWGEYIALPFKQVVPVDSKIADEQAATFFVNPITAYVLTQRVLSIPPGAWLLQTAAGSALGQMVVRLGKRFGFKTCNIVRRPEQVDQLKAAGADQVIVFDADNHEPGVLADMVKEVCGGDGVKHIIDPVGGRLGSAVIDCLGLGGQMVVFGTLSDDPLQFSSRKLMTMRASVHGFWLPRFMDQLGLLAKLKLIRAVGKLAADGTLATKIGQRFELSDVANAATSSSRDGKTLLTIGTRT